MPQQTVKGITEKQLLNNLPLHCSTAKDYRELKNTFFELIANNYLFISHNMLIKKKLLICIKPWEHINIAYMKIKINPPGAITFITEIIFN